MWNYNVGDQVLVSDEGKQGEIIAASEDAVTVKYRDGKEEVFGQDAAELQKRIDPSPSSAVDAESGDDDGNPGAI